MFRFPVVESSLRFSDVKITAVPLLLILRFYHFMYNYMNEKIEVLLVV